MRAETGILYKDEGMIGVNGEWDDDMYDMLAGL